MAAENNHGTNTGGEKTFVKGLSFIGSGVDAGYPCAVDVKDGKIVKDYLQFLSYEIVELYDGPLFDGGSILFF